MRRCAVRFAELGLLQLPLRAPAHAAHCAQAPGRRRRTALRVVAELRPRAGRAPRRAAHVRRRLLRAPALGARSAASLGQFAIDLRVRRCARSACSASSHVLAAATVPLLARRLEPPAGGVADPCSRRAQAPLGIVASAAPLREVGVLLATSTLELLDLPLALEQSVDLGVRGVEADAVAREHMTLRVTTISPVSRRSRAASAPRRLDRRRRGRAIPPAAAATPSFCSARDRQGAADRDRCRRNAAAGSDAGAKTASLPGGESPNQSAARRDVLDRDARSGARAAPLRARPPSPLRRRCPATAAAARRCLADPPGSRSARRADPASAAAPAPAGAP